MAKEFARAFYHSKAWKQCRSEYIATVYGLCERCMKRGEIKPGYILHHIIELTPDNIDDQSISLNPDNLEYLCQDCHNRVHSNRAELGYIFNDDGSIVPDTPHK